MLNIQVTRIPDVLILTARSFEDERGWFSETYNYARWAAAGVTTVFVQDNHVRSRDCGTLRGLHFQKAPSAQAKLIRVTRGMIWDVAVDIRQGSPWYGQWVAEELSEANRRQMFIPPGFAHGYVALTAECEVLYKVDRYYAPKDECGIVWDDPTLGIPWPLPPGGPIITPRDTALPAFSELADYFHWSASKSHDQ